MQNSSKLQPQQLLGIIFVVIAFLLHVYIIWSIADQPLDVSDQAPARRSIVWPLFNDSVHRIGPATDFFGLYNAGLALENGRSIYELKKEAATPYFFRFRYLPVVAQTLGRFFTLFSPVWAYRVWILMLEAGIGCLLLLFGRCLRGWLRYFSMCVLLLSTPFFLEVYMGQFTFMTVALLAIGLLIQEDANGLFSRNWRIAVNTVAYTGSVLLKAFPVVAAVSFLRKKSYWIPLIVAGCVALAVTVPYFLASPGDFKVFYRLNFETPRGFDSGNYGFVYFAFLLVSDLKSSFMVTNWDTVEGILRFVLLGSTAIFVLFSRRNNVILGSVALLLAQFLSYKHVWEHHMSGVVVLGLLLLTVVSSGELSSRKFIFFTVGCLVLLALPTPFVFLDRLKDPSVYDPFNKLAPQLRYLLVLPKVLPTLGLYLLSMFILGKSGFGWPVKFSDIKEFLGRFSKAKAAS